MKRHALALTLWAGLWALAADASAQSTCDDPALRALTPPTVSGTPPPFEFLRFTDQRSSAGHIRPVALDDWRYLWLNDALIPFFDAPDGAVAEWIHGGWLVNGVAPAAGVHATVALAYFGFDGWVESPSLLVRERRPDGWSAVALEPVFDRPLWTHDCLLSMAAPLVFTPWEEILLSGVMYYWNRDVPRALRAGPSDETPELCPVSVSRGEFLQLEVQGDWMRVGVLEMAADDCSQQPNQDRPEGWIRWRSPEEGVLLDFDRGVR